MKNLDKTFRRQHHEIISGEAVPGRIAPIEKEQRRKNLCWYVREKLPNAQIEAFHNPSKSLDLHFWPVKIKYLFRVMLPGIITQLDRWGALGHLIIYRPDDLEEDDYVVFLRFYWDVWGTAPVIARNWPAGETIAWATKLERSMLREDTLVGFRGKEGQFVGPQELAEAKDDEES